MIDLAAQVSEVIVKARRDLGDDLAGYSVPDLVADNFPRVPLITLRGVLAELKEK